jgi:hypothetical protein
MFPQSFLPNPAVVHLQSMSVVYCLVCQHHDGSYGKCIDLWWVFQLIPQHNRKALRVSNAATPTGTAATKRKPKIHVCDARLVLCFFPPITAKLVCSRETGWQSSTGGVNEASRDLENSSWCRWSPIKFPFCNEQLKSGLLFFAPTKVPFGHKGLKCRGSHSSANKVSLPRQPVWGQEEPHSRRAWWLERRASTCARSKTILSTLLVDFVSREAFDCSNTLPHILTPAKVSFFPSCSLG